MVYVCEYFERTAQQKCLRMWVSPHTTSTLRIQTRKFFNQCDDFSSIWCMTVVARYSQVRIVGISAIGIAFAPSDTCALCHPAFDSAESAQLPDSMTTDN